MKGVSGKHATITEIHFPDLVFYLPSLMLK
jgi:hypothetical protein